MYKKIYVPVDNSDHSNQAIALSIGLGRSFGSKMVGCHVYAARMHDYRFKQMEYTLPDEYLEDTELNRQRKIHDSLITMGLKLISDSYLTAMEEQCQEAGLEFEPRMMDGKHSEEIIKDLAVLSDVDLVVLGVLGLGRVRDSQVGAVCERVVRRTDRDVLIVKHVPREGEADQRDTILVGIDGSPQSFGALMNALDLAEQFDKKVEAIAVYDPYLHYTVFNGIVDVLTEKAAKVFRFEEQNQLHEEVIDTGLAQIYQSHLEVAEKLALERGVEITKTLLDGKAFQKVLNHVRKKEPWLLVLGRIGVHSELGEAGLGSNSENLFRNAPCDILFTTRQEVPQLDIKAEKSIKWTPGAQERMTRVPATAQGIARTAIYRLAVEKGHSVITSDLLDEAIERFMPKGAKATARFAEALIIDQASRRDISICRKCGTTAAEDNPVRCSVCNGEKFTVLTAEEVNDIIRAEGGEDAERAYDGKKLTWTRDAKRALWTIDDGYKRRRTKARIEKAARMRRLPTVALEFAKDLIEEETGESLVLPAANGEEAPAEVKADDGKCLIARDAQKNPFISAFEYTPEAIERVLRVPNGFMRNRTQTRIEELAAERKVTTIDLELCEEGVGIGRQVMEQMISTYQENPAGSRQAFDERSRTPRIQAADQTRPAEGLALNEVGVMSEIEAKRRELAEEE